MGGNNVMFCKVCREWSGSGRMCNHVLTHSMEVATDALPISGVVPQYVKDDPHYCYLSPTEQRRFESMMDYLPEDFNV